MERKQDIIRSRMWIIGILLFCGTTHFLFIWVNFLQMNSISLNWAKMHMSILALYFITCVIVFFLAPLLVPSKDRYASEEKGTNYLPFKGQKCKAFDEQEWRKMGDIGDNSYFYKDAKIINVRDQDGEMLVDIKFEDGRLSYGHFLSSVMLEFNGRV